MSVCYQTVTRDGSDPLPMQANTEEWRMRCFYVLVHGKLDWSVLPTDAGELARPAGFNCHRFVLAQAEADATEKAFRLVREKLDEGTGWLRDGVVRLTLEVEELAVAPMHRSLEADTGHVFYDEG